MLQSEVAEIAPGAMFSSGRAIKKIVMQAGNTVLGVSSTVALGALLLACFAVGNVVAAGINARRFEYGVLRAIGSSRWLLSKIILGEVVVIGLLAAIAGTVLGIYLAVVGMGLHRDLAGDLLRIASSRSADATQTQTPDARFLGPRAWELGIGTPRARASGLEISRPEMRHAHYSLG